MVQLVEARDWWHVHVRYGERRYKLGEWRLFSEAHKQCSASALAKALSSVDKRASRQVTETERL
jgi:hypothetical protein